MRASFAGWNGHEVDTQGDAFFVAFARATDAPAAARTAPGEEAFEAVWAEGQAMKLEQVLLASNS